MSELKKRVRRKLHRYRPLASVAMTLAGNGLILAAVAVKEWYDPGFTRSEYRILGLGFGIFVVASVLISWRIARISEPEPESLEDASRRPVTPADAARAAVRSMALAVRARAEFGLRGVDDPELVKQAGDLRGAVNRLLISSGFFETMDLADRDALSRPSGTWDQETLRRYAAEEVRAAMLGWALRVIGDASASVDRCVREYIRLIGSSHEFIANAKLREMAQLRLMRDVLWFWCRRAQLYVQRLDQPNSCDHAIEDLVREAAKAGAFDSPLEGDFPFGDRPYRELSPDDARAHLATVGARYETLCWLTGVEPEWDQAQAAGTAPVPAYHRKM